METTTSLPPIVCPLQARAQAAAVLEASRAMLAAAAAARQHLPPQQQQAAAAVAPLPRFDASVPAFAPFASTVGMPLSALFNASSSLAAAGNGAGGVRAVTAAPDLRDEAAERRAEAAAIAAAGPTAVASFHATAAPPVTDAAPAVRLTASLADLPPLLRSPFGGSLSTGGSSGGSPGAFPPIVGPARLGAAAAVLQPIAES